MDYQALFDSQLSDKPSPVNKETDYHELFKSVLESAFPVASTVKDAYEAVEPKVRPVVQAPITGVGGLIALGQGKGLQEAAEGIKAGKTAGDYVTEAIPEPETPSVAANLAGNLGREAFGGITNMGIMAAPFEAVSGSGVKPRVGVNLEPTVPVEGKALSRPYDLDITEYQKEFDSAVKPPIKDTPAAYEAAFKEAVEESKNTPKDLEVIDPKTFGRKEPYALHIGDQDFGEGKKLPLYNIWGDHPNKGSTVSAETLVKDNIPVIGKEPPKKSAAELSQEFQDMLKEDKAPEPAASNPESGQVDFTTPIAKVSEAFDTTGRDSEIGTLKAERFGDIQARQFEAETQIRDIEKGLTPEEQHALMFSETHTTPQGYNQQISELVKNPTEAMKAAEPKIHAMLETIYQQRAAMGSKMGHIENYIPSMYDLDKTPPDVINRAQSKAGFEASRTFENMPQAMEQGFVLKHNNIGDLLRAYNRSHIITTANKQLINLITKMKDVNDKPFVLPEFIQTPEGNNIKNPDIPVSYKFGGTISPLLSGYKMSPEVYDELKFMKGLDKLPLEHQVGILNATMKKAALSISFFHHITLTEGAIGLGVNPLKVLATLPKSFQVGGAAHMLPELSKDALKHGLTIGGVTDVEKGLIKDIAGVVDAGISDVVKRLTGKELESEYAQALLKPAIKAEEIWDATLWNHYHPIIKLMAYEINTAQMLRKFPGIPPAAVKRQVAEVINNAAGGQPWELLFKDQNWHRILKHGLLALDWTASNIRIAENAFEGGPKGTTARKYWMRQVLLFAAATEGLNYWTTHVQRGKGHFSWDNDPDHKMDVFLYKDKKSGRNMYLHLNKALTEPFRWLEDPMKILGHKASPVAQILVEQMSGHTIGGFDLDFAKPGNRLKSVTSKVVPFSTSDNSFVGAFPLSSGMSQTKLKEGIETAVYKGDKDALRKLMQTAQNNGIHGMRVYRQVKSEIAAKEKYLAKEKTKAGPLKQLTGFSLRDLVGKDLQSIRDRLKNGKK